MWKRDQAVSIFVRSGRFESNLTLQGKPNTHAWNTTGSFQSNRLPFIPTRGSEPPQATAGTYAHPMCAGHTSVARLQNPYSWLPLQHVFPQSNQVTKRTKYMWWEVCPLLGPIGY
jgi:hypothetical protein